MLLHPYVVTTPADSPRDMPTIASKLENGLSLFQVRQGKHAICQATAKMFGDSAHLLAKELGVLFAPGFSKDQLLEMRKAFRDQMNNAD